MSDSLLETAHIIDRQTNLVGVCNVPSGFAASGKPGVLLINAGFLHRVGPNRMNTLLARSLSANGFASWMTTKSFQKISIAPCNS